jgi:hypothetical protein
MQERDKPTTGRFRNFVHLLAEEIDRTAIKLTLNPTVRPGSQTKMISRAVLNRFPGFAAHYDVIGRVSPSNRYLAVSVHMTFKPISTITFQCAAKNGFKANQNARRVEATDRITGPRNEGTDHS